MTTFARLLTVVFLLLSQTLPAADFFRTDARRWTQNGSALMVTDLSQVEPATALTKGKRKKGHWKMLPWATARSEGWALSCYGGTGAPLVKLPLKTQGWHAIYLGVTTTSNGFVSAANGVKAKLSDEKIFRHMANTLPLQPERGDAIQELYLTVANLSGQSVEIAQMPAMAVTVCYVKAVPLTPQEIAKHLAEQKADKSKTRTSIATFDGHSWIWPYRPQTAEDLAANFRGFEESDVGKWWFQVTGADLVNYPTKVGTLPGEGTEDFSSGTNALFTSTLKSLLKKGINPLQVAREAARAQGAEFHVMIRPAGWQAAMPLEEAFNSKFYAEHPEWRCKDRDGASTMYMSYAVPEVRRHILDIYRETLALEPDGVGLLFNRGMPMMLWEDAFSDRFRQKYQADARQVAEDDPRILELRAEIMTEFLREIRALLDETAREQKREKRYAISLGTFSQEEDNRKFGIDLPRWIKEKLVDDLGVAWFSHHTSFAEPDMAYYKRITEDTKVGVYPFVISWKTGKPQDLCRKVIRYYTSGAKGIAIWDPQVERGWKESYPGYVFDTLGRLGHPSDIIRWAKEGVPTPEVIPLTRLGDNNYNRWFPNTGF